MSGIFYFSISESLQKTKKIGLYYRNILNCFFPVWSHFIVPIGLREKIQNKGKKKKYGKIVHIPVKHTHFSCAYSFALNFISNSTNYCIISCCYLICFWWKMKISMNDANNNQFHNSIIYMYIKKKNAWWEAILLMLLKTQFFLDFYNCVHVLSFNIHISIIFFT